MRSVPFKDKLARTQEPCYLILSGVPENANDGNHNPKYSHCDKEEKAADFSYR